MKKRILISAYACEPDKGSEPEVGWRWVLKKAEEFDEVVVVTRKNNRKNIEKKYVQNNIRFEYYDLPKALLGWKKRSKSVHLYAYLWEIGAFFFLKRKYNRNEFDISQRVTFVSYKYPTFIWFFSKKFILGPVAGGESYPIDFLKIFSLKGRIKEVIRFFIQRIVFVDPFVFLTMIKAHKIIAATPDTKAILPKFARRKTIIHPAIGIDKNNFFLNKEIVRNEGVLRLLYIGNLLELKGLILILKSLRIIHNKINYEFNIVGDGEDRERLSKYAKDYQLKVNFLGRKNRNELSDYYLSHDLFLYPSLHDSGGMVVLEAKAHNLKTLVSSFGGPKLFIDKNDFLIKAINVKDFVDEISHKILELNESISEKLTINI